jgi:hypothetical protein
MDHGLEKFNSVQQKSSDLERVFQVALAAGYQVGRRHGYCQRLKDEEITRGDESTAGHKAKMERRSPFELFKLHSLMSLSVIRDLPTQGSTPWSEQANDRRCKLIEKEISGTISEDEIIELKLLQMAVDEYVRRVAPRPLDELNEIKQLLLRQVS